MANSELLQNVFDLISRFTMVGGGLWLIWGTVILAGALKDKNGPQLQQGIWQIVGGGLILVAALWFTSAFDFSSLIK
ncbi:hypothetical protein [Enterococcus mundtii]|uniref:Permease n=1 Tax=Enterococcus mundtii TaxID=53346 RepID=A0A242KW44_ENTMU|nr:hypothetical protein [Enterococcus mundtii]OTP24862.1 hypothetical protein A5802_003017 [Enterococcus mundtii]